MNRFFTRPELAAEYRLPKPTSSFSPRLPPVEKNDQGELLFLEAHVDAWLAD